MLAVKASLYENFERRHKLGLPLLLVSSAVFALAHIVVAYKARCQARRKLCFDRSDMDGVSFFKGFKIFRAGLGVVCLWVFQLLFKSTLIATRIIQVKICVCVKIKFGLEVSVDCCCSFLHQVSSIIILMNGYQRVPPSASPTFFRRNDLDSTKAWDDLSWSIQCQDEGIDRHKFQVEEWPAPQFCR